MVCEQSIVHLVLFFCALVTKGSAPSNDKPVAKVVDGFVTDIKEVPYNVRLVRTYVRKDLEPSLCGSTIISNEWLITATHCTRSRFYRMSTIYLQIGVDDIRERENIPRQNNSFPEGLPRVDLIICHPNYKRVHMKRRGYDIWPVFNDICLLRVDHFLQFGSYVSRAALPWDAFGGSIHDKEFIMSGFGQTSDDIHNDPGSDQLLSSRFKLLPQDECHRKLEDAFDPATQLCTLSTYSNKSNPCRGDSGSGLIYFDSITGCPVVTGILSQGEYPRCEIPNQSPTFMNILSYKSWIKETLERYSRPTNYTSLVNYTYPARNSF